ncbi:MAG: hypothetical protein DWQ05_11025 [Calditrichaeota bacterium]|nr:MAG: hypothetical protein DWQ05_11025 [Calditrichota bacterium]
MIKITQRPEKRINGILSTTISLVTLFLLSIPVYSQNQTYLPFNTIRVRSLGLSGAVTAVRDNIGASLYNPGNYDFYSSKDGFRFSATISPLMPALVLKYPGDFFGNATYSDKDKIYASIISILKAVNFNYRNLNVGIILGEPSFISPELMDDNRFISSPTLYSNHTNSLLVNFKLADQVAIGAGLHLVYYDIENKRAYSYATSYGIMMQPKTYFRVGINILNLPKEIEKSRENYDDMTDEAIGIGTAITFPFKTTLSFDIRNLALGSNQMREKYLVGLENTVAGQVAFRTGIKFVDFASQPGYSFGIGLINSNIYHVQRYKLNHDNFLLNYAYSVDRFLGETFAIHSFSFMIHL